LKEFGFLPIVVSVTDFGFDILNRFKLRWRSLLIVAENTKVCILSLTAFLSSASSAGSGSGEASALWYS